MGKLCNLQPVRRALWGGHIISIDIVIRPFNYAESNGCYKSLTGPPWGKRGLGGLVALQSFLSLKK